MKHYFKYYNYFDFKTKTQQIVLTVKIQLKYRSNAIYGRTQEKYLLRSYNKF